MDIIIIGGHGKVAQLLEPQLVQAGHRVRAVIRSADQSTDIEATGAIPEVTDIETLDADGWDRLLEDADAVIWAAGAGGGSPERTWRVDRDAAIASMDAAQRVGARRYLMVSYFGAGPDHGVPEDDDFYAYAEAKAQADAHLKGTDLDWTLIQPSTLTLEEPTGLIDAEAAQGGQVSRGNVAAVIAAATDRTDLSGVAVAFNDGDTPISEALQRVARS